MKLQPCFDQCGAEIRRIGEAHELRVEILRRRPLLFWKDTYTMTCPRHQRHYYVRFT